MLRLTPIEEGSIIEEQFAVGTSVETITKKYNAPKKGKYEILRTDAHLRYIIDLKLPCINSITCGSGYKNAAKILGVRGEDLAGLADFSKCLVKETGDLCDVFGARGSSDKYLLNGQALEYYINELHVNEVIENTLSYTLRGILGPEEDYPRTFQRGSGDYHVYGVYWLSFPVPEAISPKFKPQDIRPVVEKAMRTNKFSRINMLINLLEHCGNESEVKRYLKRTLIYRHVPVLPLNLRPSLNMRDHPMTKAYTKLLNHNNDFSVYKNAEFETFKEYYKTLYSYLNTTIASRAEKNGLANDKNMRKVVPVLDLVKGKTGMMRAQMLKKRQDYSGRAAVVIDPFMPIDTVGVPESTIPKMYRLYALRSESLANRDILKNLSSSEYDEEIVKALKREGVLDAVPITLGRNPTLHKHGIQGFKVKPVKGRALRMSPLVCPAYNMDFDGDTAHDEIPVSPQTALEVDKLLMTDRNILLPKTGESTICPRMDILYGLYMCTRNTYTKGPVVASYKNARELKEAIYAMNVRVWETVSVAGMGTDIAGVLAFRSCFPKSVLNEADSMKDVGGKEVTGKVIKKYIKLLQDYVGPTFNNTINELVELGFKVSYLTSCSVSMLRKTSAPTEAAKAYDEAFGKFKEKMKAIDELNDYGFYDSETYSIEYGSYYDEVTKALEEGVFDKVGDNMFVRMAKSGARGDAKNLVQIYASKGRIQKSSKEVYNVVIEKGLRDQLTPIEHIIAANGARMGQIAKSIKTADTGYLTRKIVHAVASIIITEEDCGTTEGITIDKDTLATYLEKENMTDADRAEIPESLEKLLAHFITGRYTTDGLYITELMAKQLAKSEKSVTIRSPLKCKNPCCKKCYGMDTGNGRPVRIGAPVGITAGHSLSEPSTQLTLKVFQKGGVEGGSSSAFDRLLALLHKKDIRMGATTGKTPTYDPIAWAPGTLQKQQYPGRRIMLTIQPDNTEDAAKYNYDISRIVPEEVAYKIGRRVELGETLQIVKGDIYTPEVTAILGIDEAALRMVYNLYFMFRSQCDLIPIHIETVVLSLMGRKVITTDIEELKLGKYYTKVQLKHLGYDYSNTVFMDDIRGVLEAITDNVNFMESLIMENPCKAISDAVLNGLTDLCDSPLVQVALGFYAELGTRVNPNFMEE